MEAVIILGFIAVICFSFLRLYKGQAGKLKQEIEKVNQENNTNFSMERNIGSRIFVDTDNRKLYFIQATGIAGVKNYNIIKSWRLESSSHHQSNGTYTNRLLIHMNDFDKPLLTIRYSHPNLAEKDSAKLSALLNH